MDNKINVIAIVQARMGSSRLPEKVMKDIVGKPLESNKRSFSLNVLNI